MDRQMVYAGSIPLDTDLLTIQRNVLVSMGALAKAILGRDTLIDGLPCVPSGAPFSVVIGPGSYTAPFLVDSRAFGSLPPSAVETMRTATLPENTVVQLGPPPDNDHVICWLIQAAIGEVDAGPVALPYWNAANPAVPFSGPGNSGQQQATQRLLRVVMGAKPSAPQLGSGVPPEADAGWVGLYRVTTYLNKPGIEAGDIAALPEAPVLRYKLPVLPPGFTQMERFDIGNLWRVPAGVRHLRVRLVGGGGGGGSSGFSGGGGGAGGYAESLLTVVPGQSFPITVGMGGSAGGSGSSGTAGGGTAFGSLVAASGGDGGGSNNPDSHGGKPGVGSAGMLQFHGGYGGDGATIPQVPAGTGGASAFGGGGRGSYLDGVPAIGQSKGSGGGGGYGAGAPGGGGAGGLVIIEY